MPGKLIPGEKKTPIYKKSSGFKMKGWSPFKKADDNLKNIDISGMSIETLEKLKKETDPKKDPNDYMKIANTLTSKKELKEVTFLGGPTPPQKKF